MTKVNSTISRSLTPSLIGSVLVLIGFVLIGMMIGNILGFMGLMAFDKETLGFDTNNITAFFENPVYSSNAWYGLITLQGFAHLFSYTVPAILFWKFIERAPLQAWNSIRPFVNSPYLLTTVSALAVFPVISHLANWNNALQLPEALAPIENWMRMKEDSLAALTNFLVSFTTVEQLLIAILVIAIIPAIGEELLFRGILQNKIHQSGANIHVAIWVAAAIFSAIHFQFYGFFPRMILGATFGYLYWWTGNIRIPIYAHFINNGTIVLLTWLYRQGMISINIEDKNLFTVTAGLLSVAVTASVLYLIDRQHRARLSS